MSLNILFGVFNCFIYLKFLSYNKSSHGNFFLSFRNIFFSIYIKCLSVVTFCSLFFTVGEYLLFLQLTFYFIGNINQKYPGTKFSLPVAIVMGTKWLPAFSHSVAALSSSESQIFIMRLLGITDRCVHYPCFVSVIVFHLIFLSCWHKLLLVAKLSVAISMKKIVWHLSNKTPSCRLVLVSQKDWKYCHTVNSHMLAADSTQWIVKPSIT